MFTLNIDKIIGGQFEDKDFDFIMRIQILCLANNHFFEYAIEI